VTEGREARPPYERAARHGRRRSRWETFADDRTAGRREIFVSGRRPAEDAAADDVTAAAVVVVGVDAVAVDAAVVAAASVGSK